MPFIFVQVSAFDHRDMRYVGLSVGLLSLEVEIWKDEPIIPFTLSVYLGTIRYFNSCTN